MAQVKRIVCLANSRKRSGRCIAGKEVLQKGLGAWIRPVSARPSAEVSEEERRYEDGKDPRILDVIDVPVLAAAPVLHQKENYLIDPLCYWEKITTFPRDRLHELLDDPPALWIDSDSTYYGLNDRISLEQASGLRGSMLLIDPDNLNIAVRREGAKFGNPRRRVRAEFSVSGVRHVLVVTDPLAERDYLKGADGDFPVTDSYLCVSLGEVHSDGNCYKLVATIIHK